MAKKKADRKSNVGVLDREDRKVEKPRKYKVIMHNDDYTPMEFVIIILISVFKKPALEAQGLMLDVHKKGRGIAGVYSKEIAEMKCEQCKAIARESGHPFLVTTEPE